MSLKNIQNEKWIYLYSRKIYSLVCATWIIHSFNDDVDYYVQVDEIERIEAQHFANINKVA